MQKALQVIIYLIHVKYYIKSMQKALLVIIYLL